MSNRPKPTALKRLQGNPGKRPLNDQEPRLPATLPRCPQHLVGEARREWRRVVHDLHAAGLLVRVDRAALGAYCQIYARWVAAEKEVARTGLTIMTTNGNVIQNPALGVANTALESMRKYLIEFGMTPASRARLKVAPVEKEKTFEELMREAVAGLPPPQEQVHAKGN